MSDDERDTSVPEDVLEEATLPPLTEQDLKVIIANLTGLAMLGATRIEIHPARWRWLLDNILNHGAYPADKLHWMEPMKGDADDYRRCAVPLMFSTQEGLITCLLMGRQPRPEDGEYGPILDSQGGIYPRPEEEDEIDKKARAAGIWMPPKSTLQ